MRTLVLNHQLESQYLPGAAMMNTADIDAMLTVTLMDRKLSGGEKRSLAAALNVDGLDDQQRAFLRHRAFALARDEMVTPDAPAILEWLEDVVKLFSTNAPKQEVRSEAWFSPDQDCVARLAAMIRQARRSIDVCVFTITDDRISGPLLDAHDRRVRVRVLSDDEKSREPGSDIDRFRAAGIDVRLDNDPAHMHHKFAIFDDVHLLTGSYNWTRGAAEKNRENMLVTNDPALVRLYSREFEKVWIAFA